MNQLTKHFDPMRNSDHGLWQSFNQKGLVLFGHSIPRYAVSIAVSVAVHVVVIASYMGISALQSPDVMEIREITFLDLTEQTEEKSAPEAKARIKRKPIQNNTTPSTPVSRQPVVQQQHKMPPVVDRVRRQAPLNLSSHAPIALAKSEASDLLKVSAAKGVRSNKTAPVEIPAAIAFKQDNRLSVARPGKPVHFANAAGTGQGIVLNGKSDGVVSPQRQKVAMASMLPEKSKEIKTTEKKSRAYITGALSNRGIVSRIIPAFPRWAQKQGVGATISLQFTVMENGIVKENVLVLRTSGDKRWDDEVIAALKRWRFVALETLGREDQSGVITFQFVIE